MGKNIQKMLDSLQQRGQDLFRKVFSTIDHNHKLEEIMSRTEENQLPLVLWYVDY